MKCVAAVASLLLADSAVPRQMLAWKADGSCDGPDWSCLHSMTVSVPIPRRGQALIEVLGSSVNPVNIDLVLPGCEQLPAPLGCSKGILGNDGAGIVVSTGSSCSLGVGDEVYGSVGGAYAQYALVNCDGVAAKPKNLNFVDAGALPVVAGTSLQCLQSLGLPSKRSNLTVVITSGQGGTGAMGIQLAKALGATRVITAATGAGIEYVKKLGADVVVDYHEQDLFDDLLEDDSVDLVFDNLGIQGTADRAMHAIRSGGKFLVLMGGHGGTISDHPKAGVDQVFFHLDTAAAKEFQQIAAMFEGGSLQPITAAAYGFHDVKASWTDKESGHFFGKLAVVPSNMTSTNARVLV